MKIRGKISKKPLTSLGEKLQKVMDGKKLTPDEVIAILRMHKLFEKIKFSLVRILEQAVPSDYLGGVLGEASG